MATQQDVQQAKQELRESILEEGIDPNMLIEIGDMAEAVLKDLSLYPQFLQAVVQNGLAEDDDFSGEIDYQLIGFFVATREAVKQMIASGELGA
jgi:hypothetical protein